jgi:hypothetical protein
MHCSVVSFHSGSDRGDFTLLRAADRQMSLIVEALLDLSPYLRDGQIHIDIRKCDRQIALPIPYDSAGPA